MAWLGWLWDKCGRKDAPLYLEQRLCMLEEPRHNRMATLMKGNSATLLRVDDLVLLLKASNHTICRAGRWVRIRVRL